MEEVAPISKQKGSDSNCRHMWGDSLRDIWPNTACTGILSSMQSLNLIPDLHMWTNSSHMTGFCSHSSTLCEYNDKMLTWRYLRYVVLHHGDIFVLRRRKNNPFSTTSVISLLLLWDIILKEVKQTFYFTGWDTAYVIILDYWCLWLKGKKKGKKTFPNFHTWKQSAFKACSLQQRSWNSKVLKC